MQIPRRQAGDEMHWGHVLISDAYSPQQDGENTRLFCLLGIGQRYPDLVEPDRVQHLQRLAHSNEVTRVVEIQESPTKLCCLKIHHVSNKARQFRNRKGQTLRSRRCQYGSHSWPAASIHSLTAAASSGRMLRMLSSALDERRVKLSQASNSIADGDVEPGRKTDIVDATVTLVRGASTENRPYRALSV